MSREDRITREVDIIRWRDGGMERGPDVVAEERLVTFHVEPLGILDIVMTPRELREFILGHLYAEGMVDGPTDLLDVVTADRGDRLEALVELDPRLSEGAAGEQRDAAPPRRGFIQTECGATPAWPVRPLSRIERSLGMPATVVAGLPSTLRDLTDLFNATGAFHYAFLVDGDGQPRVSTYDVGRHTAVDKAIGRALDSGLDLPSLALFTTGRVSSDVARKCIRARIPLVLSRGAPLAGAVELARENALGLVGFLRGGRFNVYSGEHHVAWD